MKLSLRFKQLVVCLFMFSFAITSCGGKGDKKDEKQEMYDTKKPITSLRDGLNKMHELDQKEIFDELSGEFKYALWKDRLNEALNMKWNDQQKNLIQAAIDRLNSGIYSDTSIQRREFISFLEEWYPKTKEAFKDKDSATFKALTTTLGEPTKAGLIMQAGSGDKPDCDCALSGAIGNCDNGTNCLSKDCAINRCGIFWLYKCDGKCN